MRRFLRKSLLWSNLCVYGLALILSACAPSQPKEMANLCAIFHEKPEWYRAARTSEKKWGVPMQISMAIMKQESTFRHDAKPERTKLFYIIPWTRKSSASGYAQALEGTWAEYVAATDNDWSSRASFSDSMDFIGWYIHRSSQKAKISKWDAYAQYLAYHEGPEGYNRKTYRNKKWLKRTAQKVKDRAYTYGKQLKTCRKKLDQSIKPFWKFW